jgi:oxepin-CoA hydrolase/3-oxo-5,6-dehydrosuberyl-CoA semialdehyde dehydrogenase
MLTLRSYVAGQWLAGSGTPETLVNPATEEPLAQLSSEGIDRGAALEHARRNGGPALRTLTFTERAALLQSIADALQSAREELITLAVANGGNTRSDAKFDIDGAIATLSAYAELGRSLGTRTLLVDGEALPIGRTPRLVGQHVQVPRHGVAVHINAFNFPAWGLAEKAAVAWLAGMPVLSKPASSTALVAHRIAEIVTERQLLPSGALSLLLGDPGDLLDHVDVQDVVAFTGAGATGARIRTQPSIVQHAVRVNVEADSLNAAVIGPDVEPGSETYGLMLKDVARDITQKAGQKCTAIRRVLVPAAIAERVADDLVAALRGVVVGDPARDDVRMGPLASRAQLDHVRDGVARLGREAALLHGDNAVTPLGVDAGRGFFVAPMLFRGDLERSRAVHEREVFGPVATLLAYSGTPDVAAEVVSRGRGGLVASVYSDDTPFVRDLVLRIAPHHGRIFLGSAKIAEASPGPGTVLPMLVHGGPGHAGGGEELGGVRGLAFYQQRVALEGSRPVLDRILT